jgi:hypothetical protein
MQKTIVFVYNTDAGLFNTVTDTAHKMLSPDTYACNLCAITYSAFYIKKEWRDYILSLDMPVEFLHRNELKMKYGTDDIILPAVFIKNGKTFEVVLDSQEINTCKNVSDLINLVHHSVVNKL